MLQSTAALAALQTRLFKIYMEGRQDSFAIANGFFSDFPSDSASNTYGWLAGLTGMREWIGSRVVESMKERSYTIRNKTYEKTIGITREAIEDGMVADAIMAMQELVKVVNRLDDDLLLALIEGGQAATVAGTAYDGQYFYDTDHPIDLDSSGSQRNYYASGLALDATNIKAVVAAMKSFKGESGLPLGIGTDGLTVLAPPGKEGALYDAIEAKTISTGGENVLATKYGVKPLIWPRLSSGTRWFTFDLSLKTPGPRPFMRQVRRAPAFVSKTSPSDDNVFHNNQFLWGADSRIGAGFGMWPKAFSADT